MVVEAEWRRDRSSARRTLWMSHADAAPEAPSRAAHRAAPASSSLPRRTRSGPRSPWRDRSRPHGATHEPRPTTFRSSRGPCLKSDLARLGIWAARPTPCPRHRRSPNSISDREPSPRACSRWSWLRCPSPRQTDPPPRRLFATHDRHILCLGSLVRRVAGALFVPASIGSDYSRPSRLETTRAVREIERKRPHDPMIQSRSNPTSVEAESPPGRETLVLAVTSAGARRCAPRAR